MALFALNQQGAMLLSHDMKSLIFRKCDIEELGAAMDRCNERVARGRIYARIACRHGERGLSPEALIQLADMFDDRSIVTCAGWMSMSLLCISLSFSMVKEYGERIRGSSSENSTSHEDELAQIL